SGLSVDREPERHHRDQRLQDAREGQGLRGITRAEGGDGEGPRHRHAADLVHDEGGKVGRAARGCCAPDRVLASTSRDAPIASHDAPPVRPEPPCATYPTCPCPPSARSHWLTSRYRA